MGAIYDWVYRPRRLTILQGYALLLTFPAMIGLVLVAVDPARQLGQLALVAALIGVVVYDRVVRRARTPPAVTQGAGPGYRENARASDTREIVAFLEGRPDAQPRSSAPRPLLALGLAILLGGLGHLYVAFVFAMLGLDGIRPLHRWWVRRRLRRAGLHAELAEYEAGTRAP